MITTKKTTTETTYCNGKFKAVEASEYQKRLYNLTKRIVLSSDVEETPIESVNENEADELRANGYEAIKVGTVYQWGK